MNNYFDTYNKKDCNGCGVCSLKCPKNAIIMKEDEEGFLYPEIDKEKCIECGLCKKTCSNNKKETKNISTTYIAINKNDDDKKRSSSGGCFYPIAKYVIEKGGVVFGVAFDQNLVAKHDYAETLEGLLKFQGSKYVRSDLNGSYEKVKEFLSKGRKVLFTGTPCQCEGVRKYVGLPNDNLITCEIICHANPSPKVFKYYLKNLNQIYNKKVKNIYFRSKENGWKKQVPIVEFENNDMIEENSYHLAFSCVLINRPSCHECRFSGMARYSDFSIGDMWGINKIDSKVLDDDTGISLLNVNTKKGDEILKVIKNNMYLKSIDTKLAFSYNRPCKIKAHKNRESFFNELATGKINETNIIEYMKKYSKKSFVRRVIGKIKFFMGKLIKIK